jgi:hypothetical protein
VLDWQRKVKVFSVPSMIARHFLPAEDSVYASVCTDLDSEGLLPRSLPEPELLSLSEALSDENFADPLRPGLLQQSAQLFLQSLSAVSGSYLDTKDDRFDTYAETVLINAPTLQSLTSPANASDVLNSVARLGLKPALRLLVAQNFSPFLVDIAGRWLAFAGFDGISFVSGSNEIDKEQTLDVLESLCCLASVWEVLEP